MPANSSRSSVKREINSIFRGMKYYQREVSTNILWFEFDKLDSTSHPVYDEDPSRKWYAGKVVPVMFYKFTEDVQESTEFGHYTVNEAHFTVSTDALRRAGINNPLDTDNHFFDRFAFGPFVYSIDDYQKQGFVHGTYLTVSVRGVQVKDDEMEADFQPYTNIITPVAFPVPPLPLGPYPPAEDEG